MHEDIFQLLELVHVHLHLEVGPARVFAHVAAAKAVIGAGDAPAPRTARRPSRVTSSSSRRVCGESSSSERPSASCARLVGDLDIVERHLHVLDALAVLFGAS